MRTIYIASLGLLLLAASAFSQTVKTDFDPNADFTKYRTYAWKGAAPASETPANNNTLVDERVHNAVNGQLAMKGMSEDPQNPDFFVTFFVGQRERTEIDTFGYASAPRWRAGWGDVMVRNHREGTLVIDIIDAKTGRLAWRAYCTDTVTDPKHLEKQINKAVEKAFKKYPPDLNS